MTAFNLQQIKDAGWLKEANYIDGRWMAADGASHLAVNDPATDNQIGQIPWGGAVETRRAIDAAHAAFTSWSLTTAAERTILLNRMAQLVRDNLDILASTPASSAWPRTFSPETWHTPSVSRATCRAA